MSRLFASPEQRKWLYDWAYYLSQHRTPEELKALAAIAETPISRFLTRQAAAYQKEFGAPCLPENEVTPRACAWPWRCSL